MSVCKANLNANAEWKKMQKTVVLTIQEVQALWK